MLQNNRAKQIHKDLLVEKMVRLSENSSKEYIKTELRENGASDVFINNEDTYIFNINNTECWARQTPEENFNFGCESPQKFRGVVKSIDIAVNILKMAVTGDFSCNG